MIEASVGFQCPACVGEGRRETRRLTRPGRVREQIRVGAAVLAVAAVVVAGWYGREHLRPTQGGAAGSYPTTSHPAGVYATSGTAGSPAGPFDGTPAAGFAAGEAGIAIPGAVALDGWSRAEVADALGKVRQLIAVMYLDRHVLVDHDPAGILSLLARSSRDPVTALYRDPGRNRAVPLISAGAQLADDPPRLNGRTTVRTATDDKRHPLEITTNFVAVYPFNAPDRGPGSRIAVSHLQFTWLLYHPDDVQSDDRGLLYRQSVGYASNIDCAEFDKGFLAPPNAGVPLPGAGPGKPDNPDGYYDPNRSLNITSTCAGASASS